MSFVKGALSTIFFVCYSYNHTRQALFVCAKESYQELITQSEVKFGDTRRFSPSNPRTS